MSAAKKLRVRARGTAMVCDLAAQDAGARRFIGRKFDAALGEAGGWPSTGETHEVSAMGLHGQDYIRAVKENCLWAADAETAAHCGIEFDASFGGEDAMKEA